MEMNVLVQQQIIILQYSIDYSINVSITRLRNTLTMIEKY